MDALKNILALIIIGLTAISAYAQDQADTVLGPQPANTVEQSEETATNQAPSASVTQPSVNAMLLVRKISFEGVKTASEDMLRTLIQTQIGSEVSEELLTEDLKSLYKDTGFFSQLEVDVRPFEDSGLEIVYKVVESPKISGINIIGNENLGLGKLKDELTLRPSEIYSDRRRWESERALRQLYHEKGYYLVGIQTHLEASKTDETADTDEENTVQVTFEINEGPRVRIEEINFIGNAQVTSNKLQKKLKTRTGKPFDQMLFEEEDLSLNLRNYYQDLGFAQVKFWVMKNGLRKIKQDWYWILPLMKVPNSLLALIPWSWKAGQKPSSRKRKYVICSIPRKVRFLTAPRLMNLSENYSRLISIKATYSQRFYQSLFLMKRTVWLTLPYKSTKGM